MNLRSKTIYKVLPYILFLLVHVLLFNINTAEWGDSYRILRASEYIRQGSYPEDEKRPPLYSLVLASRPETIDPVIWSRGIMLVISLAGLILFEKFLRQYLKQDRFVFLGLLIFILNPDFLYWSVRVMADVPFALLMLSVVYLYKKWKDGWTYSKLAAVGMLAGLSILTRFEGYILAGSLLLALFLDSGLKINKKTIYKLAVYSAGAFITALPWLIYRNPLTSKYFSEPAGREYDAEMVWIYIVSLVAIYGFAPATAFIFNRKKEISGLFRDNSHISLFLLFELILILLWPAAIPRLFVAVLPILILVFVYSLEKWWDDGKQTVFLWGGAAALLGFYAGSQYSLKLQFLILDKFLLILLLLLQFVAVGSIIRKKFIATVAVLTIIMSLWSWSVITSHKDIFISVKHAAEFASKNLKGVVAYNDVSSVSDFYLNVLHTPDVSGFYYNTESKKNLTYEALDETGADYFLITNEHNTTMELDLDSREYLIPVRDFSYNINGAEFFAKIVKFERKD